MAKARLIGKCIGFKTVVFVEGCKVQTGYRHVHLWKTTWLFEVIAVCSGHGCLIRGSLNFN